MEVECDISSFRFPFQLFGRPFCILVLCNEAHRLSKTVSKSAINEYRRACHQHNGTERNRAVLNSVRETLKLCLSTACERWGNLPTMYLLSFCVLTPGLLPSHDKGIV